MVKLTEIDLVPEQSFSIEQVKKILAKARPLGIEDGFVIYYFEANDERCVIFTDQNSSIAAFAGFISRMNGKVWQAKNVETYLPFKGKQLAGKLYKFVKEVMKKSIQSDKEQSLSGAKLWTRTLPALGLKPMIFDTVTQNVIDPQSGQINIYSSNPDDIGRYTWILERRDHYNNVGLNENSIIMPFTGIWYTLNTKENNE